MAAVRGGGIITSRKRCHSLVFVFTAIMNFGCAEMVKRNTVLIRATSQIADRQGALMTECEKNLAYQSAMAQARAMIKKGIISEEELIKIETLMAKKYNLDLGDLHRDIDLLKLGSRGNMPYYEGGV